MHARHFASVMHRFVQDKARWRNQTVRVGEIKYGMAKIWLILPRAKTFLVDVNDLKKIAR